MATDTLKKKTKTSKQPPKLGKKVKASVKPTVLTFLLDETGSMDNIKDDTIGGFNAFVAEQKKIKTPLEMTFIKFDSIDPFNIVYKAKPIKDVPNLSEETYKPRDMTPLVDSAYRAIITTEQEVAARKDKPSVLIVIQTDGHENSSREHTGEQLKQLIERKQGEGWVFVFMGAGINAYATAKSFGISEKTTSSYDRGMSEQAFSNLSQNTSMLRTSGMAASMNYTSDQLKAQGDSYFNKAGTAQTPHSLGHGLGMGIKKDPLKQKFTKA